LTMQRNLSVTPRIFNVNWFRKDADGNFIWPGYSQNMRILRWIVERSRSQAAGTETAIGWMPRYEDIYWDGLNFTKEQFEALQSIDPASWRSEVIGHEELFIDLHDHLPPEMIFERELLICRL
jgi:phosphoenolpyruvate carboxykinase (GTP)